MRPTALSLVSEFLTANQYTLFMPFYILSQRKKGQELNLLSTVSGPSHTLAPLITPTTL